MRKLLLALNVGCTYEPSPDLIEYDFLVWDCFGATVKFSPINGKSSYLHILRYRNHVPIETDDLIEYESFDELVIALRDMKLLPSEQKKISRPKYDPSKTPSAAVQVLIDKHFKNKST